MDRKEGDIAAPRPPNEPQAQQEQDPGVSRFQLSFHPVTSDIVWTEGRNGESAFPDSLYSRYDRSGLDPLRPLILTPPDGTRLEEDASLERARRISPSLTRFIQREEETTIEVDENGFPFIPSTQPPIPSLAIPSTAPPERLRGNGSTTLVLPEATGRHTELEDRTDSDLLVGYDIINEDEWTFPRGDRFPDEPDNGLKQEDDILLVSSVPSQTHGSTPSRVQPYSTAPDFYKDCGDSFWAGGTRGAVAVPQGLSDLARRGGDGDSDDEGDRRRPQRIGHVKDAEDVIAVEKEDEDDDGRELEPEDRKGKGKAKPALKAAKTGNQVGVTDSTTSPPAFSSDNRPRDFGFFI